MEGVQNQQAQANNNTDPQSPQAQNQQVQNQEPGRLAQQAGTEPQAQNQKPDPQNPQGAPEAYDFTSALPEGETLDEAISQKFGEICKGMNLTNEQANQMAAYGFEYGKGLIQQMNDMREAQYDKWQEETRKELGADFEKTMNEYGAGLQHLEKTCPGIRKLLSETGVGDRIEIVRAFSELGRLVSEDGGVGGGNPQGGKTSMYPNTNFENY
jgi:hypothetical protein|nr:MAG TPA: putative protease [Caudoviricetes sp.]